TRLIKPNQVLETGTWLGLSSCAIGLALLSNGFGHVTTLEINQEAHAKALENINQYKVQSVVTALLASSMEFVPDCTYDMAVFDSDLSIRTAEFRRLRASLSEHAVIVFHNAAPQHGTVDKAIRSLMFRRVIEGVDLPTPRGIFVGRLKARRRAPKGKKPSWHTLRRAVRVLRKGKAAILPRIRRPGVHWRDLAGVFRRPDAPPLEAVTSRSAPAPPIWNGTPETAEEETRKGTAFYSEILDRLHRELAPAHYLEIGVRRGVSLALARGPATGVDPAPALDRELPPTTRVLSLTSDDFFAGNAGGIVPDLCFIDGMHLFEYALRDFMNVERRAAPGALVVIDDIFPNHPAQAQRERRTRTWTGDIWRLAEVLRRHRPDLFLLPLDVAPTGLLLVAGLDPANRVFWDDYNSLVGKAREPMQLPQSVLERRDALDPAGDELRRVIDTMKTARAEGCPPHEIVSRLRRALDNNSADLRSRRPGNPKLSLILISYNMARELSRTLRSLSPAMQRGIDPEDYEVILIDNGSTQALDEAELRGLLPNLILHRFQNATASPVPAINFGLTLARGDLVGVSIDGARMASPGLLAKALAASRLHERPVIGTIAFHLGPEAQMESIKKGYNRAVEDRLLARSGWELDGYRLFTISAFAGSSAGGWFQLPAESNVLFLRAEHWRVLGGWDEGFVTPGGGLANLDIWSRACADPKGELIMLLGEATFHQIHGGIATNNRGAPQALFQEEYIRLRGRAYHRPTRQPLYFGTLPEAARTSLKFSAAHL
ncbi:MAG: class I SAM-dependent methyltransferase, partial [Terriglobia bacterium]